MPARRTLRAAAEMIGCAVLGLAQQPARLILVIWRARDSTFTRVGVIAAVLGALVPVWLAYVGPTGPTRSSPQPAVDRTGSPATTAQQLPDDSSRCVPAIPSPRHDGPDFVVCVEAGKEVRTEGWQDELVTAPLSTFGLLLTYRNIGAVQQDNVVLKLELPDDELAYLEGTSALHSNQGDYQVSDNVLAPAGGVNIGSFSPGGAGYVTLAVRTRDPKEFFCGRNSVVVRVFAETDHGTKRDDLVVHVVRRCDQAD